MKFNYYRPEIDGIRAISVLAVIFYHAQIVFFEKQLFAGGFIGVDIFFVISGYLITSIILRELKDKGKFSFLNFYKRRARRILPALFFVMLISFPFAYYYLLPNFFINYSESIISSLGFISNFYFWSLGAGYDQLQNVAFQPFLHTWSLSVEEQFYFIYPIILIACFKYFNNYLISLIVVGILISLGFSNWASHTHASINFYVLPARGWELLAGALLAKLEISYGRNNNKVLSHTLPLVGTILIFYSFLFYNDNMFLPSFLTLSPILGVCLIIWFAHKDELITKIFSNKLCVGVGLISYSLYLWHYPIFILFTKINIFYLIMITFVLSILSYFFIEKPFRKKIKSKFYNLKTLALLFGLILFLNIFVIYNNGFYNSDRYPQMVNNIVSQDLFKNNKKTVVHSKSIDAEKNNIYISGDSHMGVLVEAIKIHPKIEEYNFLKFISSGCYYIYDFDKVQKYTQEVQEYCNKQIQTKRRKEFLSKENSILIMGGRLPMHLSGNRYNNLEGGKEGKEWWTFKNDNNLSISEGVKKSIIDLLNNNLKIILIYPVPPVGWNIPKKIIDNYMWNKDNFDSFLNNNPITTSYLNFINYSKKSFETLDSIDHPNLYRVFPHKIFCDKQIKNRCITHDNKSIFYSDNNHLSLKGNKIVAELIVQEIKKIEEKNRN